MEAVSPYSTSVEIPVIINGSVVIQAFRQSMFMAIFQSSLVNLLKDGLDYQLKVMRVMCGNAVYCLLCGLVGLHQKKVRLEIELFMIL